MSTVGGLGRRRLWQSSYPREGSTAFGWVADLKKKKKKCLVIIIYLIIFGFLFVVCSSRTIFGKKPKVHVHLASWKHGNRDTGLNMACTE